MSVYLGKRSAVTLRVPYILKRRIKRLAKTKGLSVNAWMVECVQKSVAKESK